MAGKAVSRPHTRLGLANPSHYAGNLAIPREQDGEPLSEARPGLANPGHAGGFGNPRGEDME